MNALVYDVGIAELRFPFALPTDFATNTTYYQDKVINLRLQCLLAPHPMLASGSIMRYTIGYIDAELPPTEDKVWDVSQRLPMVTDVPRPQLNATTRPTTQYIAVRNVTLHDSSLITTVPTTNGKVIAGHTITFDLIQTFDTTQKLCAYPGMSLILNVTKSQCFDNVVCQFTGNNAHHSMDTLRDAVLRQYGDLQVGVYNGIDTALRNTAYCPQGNTPLAQVDLFGMQCTAKISTPFQSGTTGRLSAQTGIPVVHSLTESIPGAPLWDIVSFGNDVVAEFELIDEPLIEWRCQKPGGNGNEWLKCDSAEYLAALKAHTTCADACNCSAQRPSQCIHVNASPRALILDDTTLCGAKTTPSTYQITTPADCAHCKTQPNTMFNWGPNCDITPEIPYFQYAPVIPATADNLIDYNNNITFTIKYRGSPTNQITLHAKSASFSPFNTITLTTLPIPTTSTLGADQLHTITFVYALKRLGFDKALNNLTFFATVGKNVQSPTTGTK